MRTKILSLFLSAFFIITNFYCSSSENDGSSSTGKTEKSINDLKNTVVNRGKPRIIIDTTEFNFGEIPEGAETTHYFKVTNSGNDTLKISDVEASCGCTTPEPRKMNLTPKESTKIKVTFNSRGRIGYNEKSVVIFSNDPVEPQKQLLMKGKVLPRSN